MLRPANRISSSFPSPSLRTFLIHPIRVLSKYTKWLNELCSEGWLGIRDGSFPPPPTIFHGKLEDKTRAIIVDLHIPKTTTVLGFLTAHIMDPDR